MPEALRKVTESEAAAKVRAAKPILAVAKDEAFCFFYRDNLELLASLGAKIEYFSPLSDAEPPKNTDGFLFCGGYPELHAEELSENQTMRTKIRDNIRQGMPVLAECGGYMYLSESMEDMDGNVYPMVQAVPGNVYRTKSWEDSAISPSRQTRRIPFGTAEIRCAAMSSITLTAQTAEVHGMRQNRCGSGTGNAFMRQNG